ncbi:Rv3654c family TadE-like protein [Diaminobutyricibacter sp. McL0618]|uniref:Rv3654c family TadE-like protein n=1 Tax=Leifsonia sp. McL0618 TaxID=3415677 RepID=UPI003CE940E5
MKRFRRQAAPFGAAPVPPTEQAAGDRGSVTVVAIGLIAGVVALTGGIAAISAALVFKQRIAGAADSAAVAAADVVSGAVPGYPCARAEEAARLNGAVLIDCTIDGMIASVLVSAYVLTFEVRARARAGPPDGVVGSVENGLEKVVVDGARPAVERVVGGELDATASRVEVVLASRLRPDLESRARVTGLQELGGDGLSLERAIGQLRGVRPY